MHGNSVAPLSTVANVQNNSMSDAEGYEVGDTNDEVVMESPEERKRRIMAHRVAVRAAYMREGMMARNGRSQDKLPVAADPSACMSPESSTTRERHDPHYMSPPGALPKLPHSSQSSSSSALSSSDDQEGNAMH